jgi:hypothetical protein
MKVVKDDEVHRKRRMALGRSLCSTHESVSKDCSLELRC